MCKCDVEVPHFVSFPLLLREINHPVGKISINAITTTGATSNYSAKRRIGLPPARRQLFGPPRPASGPRIRSGAYPDNADRWRVGRENAASTAPDWPGPASARAPWYRSPLHRPRRSCSASRRASRTVSDIWPLIEWVFFLPGDLLVLTLMAGGPEVATFLELTTESLGGSISGVVSFMAWLVVLGFVMNMLGFVMNIWASITRSE